MFLYHTASVNTQNVEFNFPDDPPSDLTDNSDTNPLGRQATVTVLPGFPTLTTSIPPTIINRATGQTCICVPTGSCTPGTGTDGLIDIRMATKQAVSMRK